MYPCLKKAKIDESSSPMDVYVPSNPNDIRLHVSAFKNAIRSRGSLSFHIAQCITFGPPGVGKTSLLHSILGQTPPGTPTTRTTVGSGSLSTDVVSESDEIIPIEIKFDEDRGQAVSIVLDEDGKWSLVKTLKDEIALYMKSFLYRTEYNRYSEHDVEPDVPLQSFDNRSNTSNTAISSMRSRSSLDDEVIDAITRHVEGENVDLSEVQILLDTSTMIYYTDVSGQPEFPEVLAFLMAGPTIFLLVFDLHQPLDSKYNILYDVLSEKYKLSDCSITVRESLTECVSSISSYQHNETRDFMYDQLIGCLAPPTSILPVATHSDLVSEDDFIKIDCDIRKSFYNIDLDMIVEPLTTYQTIIPIDNHNPQDSANVKNVIHRVIKRRLRGVSPYYVELPAHWLAFQLYLRQYGKPTITYSECQRISERFRIPDEDLVSCLWYLHYKTGTIRYYHNVKKLKGIVILQPKILFIAIAKFLTTTFCHDNVDHVVINNLKTFGLFRNSQIHFIFNELQDELGITYDQFIALLLLYNVIFPAYDEEFDFFFPAALRHASEYKPFPYHVSNIISLFILFECGFVPKGFFSGLFCSLIKRSWSPTYNHKHIPQVYHNKVVLSFRHKVSDDIDCILTASPSFVEIDLQICDGDQYDVLCPHTRDFIASSMIDVCSRLCHNNVWKYGVICNNNECVENKVPQHFAEFNLKLGKLMCQVTKRRYRPNAKEMIWLKGYTEASSVLTHEPDILLIKENQVELKKAKVQNCLNVSQFHSIQGIIFIIGMFGPNGTANDVQNVESTFKKLNFATYVERDPTAQEISDLVTAASMCQYASSYKYICFYFAGHGGRDKDGQLYIKGLQLDKANPVIIHIEEYITKPLRSIGNLIRLFFFDICQTSGKGVPFRGNNNTPAENPKVVSGELIAYSSSEGQSSFGDRTKGGIWTYYLCKTIKKNLPITEVLAITADIVKDERNKSQEPITLCDIEFDKVVLNQGDCSLESGSSSESSSESESAVEPEPSTRGVSLISLHDSTNEEVMDTTDECLLGQLTQPRTN